MTELVSMSELQLRRLRKAIPYATDDLIWVADWLFHLNLFSDAQVYDILRFVRPVVESLSSQTDSGEAVPVCTLAVCDGRWVSISNKDCFFDADVSEEVPRMDEYALTIIMCDLNVLRRRMLKRISRLGAAKQK
jgi:hypothetical protein